MAQASFSFNPYPFRYSAKYKTEGSNEAWKETITELSHRGTEEQNLEAQERQRLIQERNAAGHFPFVNFSTQYGLGCFEGLKAYPQPDGTLALFRPEKNAERFYRSMEALYMPPFNREKFVSASKKILSLSYEKGFSPHFDKTWEATHFSTARTVYLRPFTYPESGLGLNISVNPWVIIYASEVGNYLEIKELPSLVVSDKIRATPNGTGWIKCNSNYVISILAKKEAVLKGFTETLFLDSERKHVEECSSCNVFFVLKNGTVVTPPLGDTILPGITRESVIILARDMGILVEERKIPIDEVLSDAKECFATGTAVGVEHFGTLTYNEKTVTFGNGRIGETANLLQTTLKKIQYGLKEDTYNWLLPSAP